MQEPWGVLGQMEGCLIEIWGPFESSSFDFLESNACVLTPEHGEDHLLAIRSMREATWRLGLWGLWWVIWWDAALESVRKNNIGIMGGPGNRTQVPEITKCIANHYTNPARLLI